LLFNGPCSVNDDLADMNVASHLDFTGCKPDMSAIAAR